MLDEESWQAVSPHVPCYDQTEIARAQNIVPALVILVRPFCQATHFRGVWRPWLPTLSAAQIQNGFSIRRRGSMGSSSGGDSHLPN